MTKTFVNFKGFVNYLSILNYTCTPNLCVNQDNRSETINALKRFRCSYLKNLIICHLNINGLRNKFYEISDMLTQNLVDVLFLTETKLDASFPIAQFSLPGYKTIRADRKSNGGGLMSVIRSDIAHRRRSDLESLSYHPVESMIIEIAVRQEKWLFVYLYSPHGKHKAVCCKVIDNILNAAQKEFGMIFVMGDLNINVLCKIESKGLADIMNTHDLRNIVKGPTCFKSVNSTCLDLIITRDNRRISSTININTGISDFHHLVGFSTKLHFPKCKKAMIPII